MLPQVSATRYVTPLREGGSLPAIMEADDLGTYVVKFCGAGQGRKALVAEVVSARLARACGLAVPDLVAVDLDPDLAAGEPDQEIQELLRASGGLNLGVDFLAGAVDFDAAATVDGGLAGRIIWFDALVSNADRSWRNPNMLFWREQLYLIDHGATLPDDWLEPEPGLPEPELIRQAHIRLLSSRLANREAWLAGMRETARQPGLPRRVPARSARPDWLARSPRRRCDGGSWS